MSFRSFLLLTAIFTMVASGCKKNKTYYFPNVAVDEYIYINNPSSYNLLSPGGWIYHAGGYKGLIIYRVKQTGGSDDFVAYDRGCPSHYANNCGTLEVTSDDLYAKCGCEDEKYLLLNGAPSDGANLPLQVYRTTFDGNVIHIYN